MQPALKKTNSIRLVVSTQCVTHATDGQTDTTAIAHTALACSASCDKKHRFKQCRRTMRERTGDDETVT